MADIPFVDLPNAECPRCKNDRHVYCEECAQPWAFCNCADSLMQCELCSDYFTWVPDEIPDELEAETFYYDFDKEFDEAMASKKASKKASSNKKKPTAYYGGVSKDDWWSNSVLDNNKNYKTCEHMMEPVVFARDGESVTIYASAGRHQNIRKAGQMPDFGLYADAIWKPVARNEFINWPDFKTPAQDEVAAIQILDGFIRACSGERVETGCIGGHGRTGTILACMGVCAGLEPAESIKFVRDSYCSHAVETADQERWVEWFQGYLFQEVN